MFVKPFIKKYNVEVELFSLRLKCVAPEGQCGHCDCKDIKPK